MAKWRTVLRTLAVVMVAIGTGVLTSNIIISAFSKPLEQVYRDEYVPSWMDGYRNRTFKVITKYKENNQLYASSGSGFYIGKGYVITAFHVVEDDEDQVLDLESWNARLRMKIKDRAAVWHTDEYHDIAVLKLEDPSGFTEGFRLGSSDDLVPNGLIHIVGCPSGSFPPTISSGVLRAEGQSSIHIDTGVWYGFSGGPVIDGDTGKVIGVVVQIGFRRDHYKWRLTPNTDLGIAVHIDVLRELLEKWGVPYNVTSDSD